VRVPFYVRGPGVPAGTTQPGLASLIDVGATVLELTGAAPPGARTTDGRSLVPLLASPLPPPGWRTQTLVEMPGIPYQFMNACDNVFDAQPCPSPDDSAYLIDGPQSAFTMLRVVNATHDLTYAEFRPWTDYPSPSASNWTEAYDNARDFYQFNNTAVDGTLSPGQLAALHDALWAVGLCEGATCP